MFLEDKFNGQTIKLIYPPTMTNAQRSWENVWFRLDTKTGGIDLSRIRSILVDLYS